MRNYPDLLLPIVETLRGVLADAGVPVGMAHLTPGSQPAWDDCCNGQAYLRVIEVNPSASGRGSFPGRDSVQPGVGCGIVMLSLHLGLGIIRCAHTVDDHGTPPTAAQMTADASLMLDDMGTMLEVLTQVVSQTKGLERISIGGWTPRGVQGGCVGGEWDFWIGVDPCLGQ